MNCISEPSILLGDQVACMINNMGGMSMLELNIVAKEAIHYLGEK